MVNWNSQFAVVVVVVVLLKFHLIWNANHLFDISVQCAISSTNAISLAHLSCRERDPHSNSVSRAIAVRMYGANETFISPAKIVYHVWAEEINFVWAEAVVGSKNPLYAQCDVPLKGVSSAYWNGFVWVFCIKQRTIDPLKTVKYTFLCDIFCDPFLGWYTRWEK